MVVGICSSNDPLEAVSCLLRKRSFKIYFENFKINRKLLSQEFHFEVPMAEAIKELRRGKGILF